MGPTIQPRASSSYIAYLAPWLTTMLLLASSSAQVSAKGTCSLCFTLNMTTIPWFGPGSIAQIDALLATASSVCKIPFTASDSVESGSWKTLEVCSNASTPAEASTAYSAFMEASEDLAWRITSNDDIGMDCMPACCTPEERKTDPHCYNHGGYADTMIVNNTCNSSQVSTPFTRPQCRFTVDCLDSITPPPESALAPPLPSASKTGQAPPPPSSKSPQPAVTVRPSPSGGAANKPSPPRVLPGANNPPIASCALCFYLDATANYYGIKGTAGGALAKIAGDAFTRSFTPYPQDAWNLQVCSPYTSQGEVSAAYHSFLKRTRTDKQFQLKFTANSAIGMDCAVGCCDDDAEKLRDPYCTGNTGFTDKLYIGNTCNSSETSRAFSPPPQRCSWHADFCTPLPSPVAGIRTPSPPSPSAKASPSPVPTSIKPPPKATSPSPPAAKASPPPVAKALPPPAAKASPSPVAKATPSPPAAKASPPPAAKASPSPVAKATPSPPPAKASPSPPAAKAPPPPVAKATPFPSVKSPPPKSASPSPPVARPKSPPSKLVSQSPPAPSPGKTSSPPPKAVPSPIKRSPVPSPPKVVSPVSPQPKPAPAPKANAVSPPVPTAMAAPPPKATSPASPRPSPAKLVSKPTPVSTTPPTPSPPKAKSPVLPPPATKASSPPPPKSLPPPAVSTSLSPSPPHSPPPPFPAEPARCYLCFELDLSARPYHTIDQPRAAAFLAAARSATNAPYAIRSGLATGVMKICGFPAFASTTSKAYTNFTSRASELLPIFTLNRALGMDCIVGCCSDEDKKTDPYCEGAVGAPGWTDKLTISNTCNSMQTSRHTPAQCINHYDCLRAPEPAWPPFDPQGPPFPPAPAGSNTRPLMRRSPKQPHPQRSGPRQPRPPQPKLIYTPTRALEASPSPRLYRPRLHQRPRLPPVA